MAGYPFLFSVPFTRERTNWAVFVITGLVWDGLGVRPNDPPDKPHDNQKAYDFEKGNHLKLRFGESTFVHPTIDSGTLAGHTNQMIGVLALAELIDVGNLGLTTLAGRTVGGICICIMLIAIVVDDITNLGSPP